MRLVCWNILHGGGPRRTPLIALRLCDLSPDLVVLTEFRRTTGGQIAGVLHDCGLVHQATTGPAAGRNGVFIAARTPLVPGEPGPAAWASNRWLDVWMPEVGVWLTGVHAPDAHRSDAGRLQRQAAFWQHVVRTCRARRDGCHLVAGDLNAGRHGLDEAGRSFTGPAFLGRLASMGYRDGYRLLSPRDRSPTWVSPAGSGFRIDAVWVSEAMSRGVRRAWHEGPALDSGESDHAPVVVDFDCA